MKNMHQNFHAQGHGPSVDFSGSGLALPVLSDEAVASLRFMIEEEKMAGDLYEAFYLQTGSSIFSRIAASEDRHMDALLNQANLAGIDVSDLLVLPAGEYQDPALQSLFDDLYETGSVSQEAALSVGLFVEQTDMVDLNNALDDVAGTSLVGVYSRLLSGSENHLAAFDMWLA